MASTIVGPKEVNVCASSSALKIYPRHFAKYPLVQDKVSKKLRVFCRLAASFLNSFSISILSHLVFLLGIGAAF